jgi:hypothetical protein
MTNAFSLLNVFQPGESIPDTDAQFALRMLNMMVGGWRQQSLLVPATIREPLAFVANQPSYTVGVGGDWDIDKPPNQASVVGASLIDAGAAPTVEIPLTVLTDDAYNALPVKGLTSSQPYAIYYNPTFTATFGTAYPVPIPNTTVNTLALYTNRPITTFRDLTTTYAFPDGYEDALTLHLARKLAVPYGRPFDGDLKEQADQAMMTIKRANLRLVAMSNYFGGGPSSYDIYSG